MFRQNFSTPKPDNVLKRVNELIASATGPNADKEKQFALEQLHSVVSNSRRKQWTKTYESIMEKHMELCVDLRDNRLAKDGLHQYRNMVNQTEPQSLENVTVHLLNLAEERAKAAREKSDKVSLAAAAKVSDLDQAETPESIMLSTMTIEGAKDRTDRAVVVPWLKFLWDAYRAVLELLHKNSKLENAYKKTCEKAFSFCKEYQRTLEFRRLCDMLRQQLSNLQRFAAQPARNNRPAWEWTSESIEIQLQIRFSQLEVATSLEQWNEGFRTIEDIHQIMQLSNKPPKPKLMAQYYEKLTRIFWVSKNLLFHAYAWFKYYTLCCASKKEMKAEERVMMATNAVLAALCTPDDANEANVGGFRSNLALFDDAAVVNEKKQQLAALLGFTVTPSRNGLLAELAAKGVFNDVLPELKSAHTVLEDKFHPLTLVKRILPIVSFVKSHPQLKVYSEPLQRIAALHTVSQLSRVYSSIRIASVQKLFSSLDYNFVEIEDMLCDAVNRKQLSMQIDHSTGCYRFGTSVDVASAVENQLTNVGRTLKNVVTQISVPSLADARKRRQLFLQRVSEASKKQYDVFQERKNIIDRRKKGLELLVREKKNIEVHRKQEEEEFRRKEERDRLEKEEEERRKKKLQAQHDQNHVNRIRIELEALGKDMDEATLKDMDEKERNEVLAKAQQEVRKAKEEEAKRLAEQAKVLDYITRAIRMEAGKNVAPQYEMQLALDRAAYDLKLKQTRELQKANHASLLAAKKRLQKLNGAPRKEFEAKILEKQRAKYEKKLQAAKEAAWEEHRARKISKARFAKSEEEDRLLEEAERQREIAQEEENKRLQAKQHEELRIQRERELEEARRAEEEEENIRQERAKLEAEKRERELSSRDMRDDSRFGSARDAGEEPSGWQRQPPRERDMGPPRNSSRWGDGGRSEGDWAKRGPPADSDRNTEDRDRWRDGGRPPARSGQSDRFFGRGGDSNGNDGAEWNTVPSKGWGKFQPSSDRGRYDRDRDRDRDRTRPGGADKDSWRR